MDNSSAIKSATHPNISLAKSSPTRAEAGGSTSSDASNRIPPVLDIILGHVPGLPPAMHIMPKLLKALGDPNADISDIADLIAFDPGLTVKLIQSCNSAAFAGDILVTDVGQAVNRLGMNTVFQLTAALAGKLVFKAPAVAAVLDLDKLWEHSVIVALAASILAKDRDADASAAFTAGLLHESGKVVMAQAFREHYGNLLSTYHDTPDQLLMRERETFGFDHPEAGGRMLARGAFPDVIVASVTYQHRPEKAETQVLAAALLDVANALAEQVRNGVDGPIAAEPTNGRALFLLGLDPDSMPVYRERIAEEFKFANALCRL